METSQVRLTIPDSVDATTLLGPADCVLRRIEQATDAMVVVRGSKISLSGKPAEVRRLTSVFSALIEQARAGALITERDAELLLDAGAPASRSASQSACDAPAQGDAVLRTHRGHALVPKTSGQRRYLDAVAANTITFALGPAGTGKTYLAVAMAVRALMSHEVDRIVLCRPVVEAGETLGFLPGTLQEKLDPYVRPLYDALFDMVGAERTQALIEQSTVEVAPLAYMRGRTLNRAFVILDEAQNTTPEQMKMFLTRLGEGSTFVITGDATQRDLTGPSGLASSRSVLEGIEQIAFVDLGREDIVRHSLVARIVCAYERSAASGISHSLPKED